METGPYHQAVDLALRRNCTEIGVWMDWADYDYPLWVLLISLRDRTVSVTCW